MFVAEYLGKKREIQRQRHRAVVLRQSNLFAQVRVLHVRPNERKPSCHGMTQTLTPRMKYRYLASDGKVEILRRHMPQSVVAFDEIIQLRQKKD
eukprot:2543737-Prorocentrum_lima.AAC.1